MADPRIVGEWLDKAEQDYFFAEANLKENSFFYAQICFHFQQSAEKYLKAFIIAHDSELEKIHNLIYLLKTCQKIEPSLASLYDDCELLNAAYIDTRYPVHWPTNYTNEKALQAKEAVLRISEKVRSLLAGEE